MKRDFRWAFLSILTVMLLMDSSAPYAAESVSTRANSVVATVPVGFGPAGIAFDSANGYLYVANEGGVPSYGEYRTSPGNTSVIDGRTNTVIASLQTGGGSREVVFDPLNGKVYVTGPHRISIIEDTFHPLINNLTGFSNPSAIAVDTKSGNLYVAEYQSNRPTLSGSVVVLSGNDGATLANLSITYAHAIAYDSFDGNAYVAGSGAGRGGILVINCSTNTVIANVSGSAATSDGAVTAIAFDPVNREMYAALEEPDAPGIVEEVDPSTNTVTSSVTVGYSPSAIAIDASNGDIFVANTYSSSVSVINGSTNSLIANVPVDGGPGGVAYDSANGDVYVTNFDGNDVSVISTSSPQGTATSLKAESISTEMPPTTIALPRWARPGTTFTYDTISSAGTIYSQSSALVRFDPASQQDQYEPTTFAFFP